MMQGKSGVSPPEHEQTPGTEPPPTPHQFSGLTASRVLPCLILRQTSPLVFDRRRMFDRHFLEKKVCGVGKGFQEQSRNQCDGNSCQEGGGNSKRVYRMGEE